MNDFIIEHLKTILAVMAVGAIGMVVVFYAKNPGRFVDDVAQLFRK